MMKRGKQTTTPDRLASQMQRNVTNSDGTPPLFRHSQRRAAISYPETERETEAASTASPFNHGAVIDGRQV
jgi:hypothetical protein